ncbi:MAG: hypothetical protein ACUVQM_01175 [Candidatus Hadarchaeaceae archaeon]
MPKLFEIKELSDSSIRLVKSTRELDVEVEVSLEKKKTEIATGLAFLDHMLETIAWGACMSIGAAVNVKKKLTATITEDVGITLGTALAHLFELRAKVGVNGAGAGLFALDDALARAMVSVEGRRNIFVGLDAEGAKSERVEDLYTSDCVAFLEGLSQGLKATIHLDILKGQEPHHCWEAASRALGEALGAVFKKNSWRPASDNPYYAEEGLALL